MLNKVSIVLASIAGLASAAPASNLEARFGDSYTLYQGNGTPGAGWPDWSRWLNFNDLWNANQVVLQNSCNWNNWGANNSPSEINSIKNAINQVAGETGVDSRLILTVVLQESKGCVRAPTTNNGVVNPGLMQSHNGSGTCAGQSNCSYDRVLQMIRDGTAGTSSGAGLKGTLNQARGVVGNNPRAFYAAARIYNSGSIDWNNFNNGLGSTNCYASDIANRFQGWALAQTKCF